MIAVNRMTKFLNRMLDAVAFGLLIVLLKAIAGVARFYNRDAPRLEHPLPTSGTTSPRHRLVGEARL